MEFLRTACVIIDRYGLRIAHKNQSQANDRPLALVEKISDKSKVLSSFVPGSSENIPVGMTLGKARCMYPDVVALTPLKSREQSVSKSLIRKMHTISPFIERSDSGIFYLDVTGLRLHYHSEDDLALRLLEIIRRAGFNGTVGIASNKFVAHTAALSTQSGVKLIDEGDERQFLKSLNVDYLPVFGEAIEKLHDLGLHTIGSLAQFPSNEFSHRFGAEGALLSTLALGQDVNHFVRLKQESAISRKLNFTEGITHLMHLLRIVHDALDALFGDYLPVTMGCSEIEFRLKLEDRTILRAKVALSQPTAEPKKIVSQLELKLSDSKLTSAVKEIVLSVFEFTNLENRQLSLNSLKGKSDSKAVLSKELFERYRLHQPQYRLAHLPDIVAQEKEEIFNRRPIDSLAERDYFFPAYSLRTLAGLRLFNPSLKTMVTSRNGRLHLIKYRNDFCTIASQRGPWEVSTNWWDALVERIYYEISTDSFQIFLVYYDRHQSAWFVQGVYD